jgi:hypothetical protein
MNRTIYLFLGLTVMAGLVSCGKTNVRKLAGDWTVTYEEQMNDRSLDDTTDRQTLQLTETTATSTTEFGTAGATFPYTVSGKVAVNNFVIRKDGTWTWNRDYETTDPDYSNRVLQERSGTWSFVGKSGRRGGGYGRRERVIFHVLFERVYVGNSSVFTGEVLPPEVDDTRILANGYRDMTFVVESSEKDELHLVSEGNSFSTSDYNYPYTSARAFRHRLTLKQH